MKLSQLIKVLKSTQKEFDYDPEVYLDDGEYVTDECKPIKSVSIAGDVYLLTYGD